jgi:hypothetical protein
MASSDAAAVVEQFFDAWTASDFERARRFLHDQEFRFEGPIDTFDDVDAYLDSLRRLAPIITGAERLKVFGDAGDVCVIYELRTEPVPRSRIAEWYRVRDGRIESILVMFDARPFAPLFAHQGQP